ncbi:hypothetical protein Hanom_Chr00s004448g01722671 [Helianthus anomalus]
MNNGITIRSTQRSHKEYGIRKLHLQNGLSCPWHGPWFCTKYRICNLKITPHFLIMSKY